MVSIKEYIDSQGKDPMFGQYFNQTNTIPDNVTIHLDDGIRYNISGTMLYCDINVLCGIDLNRIGYLIIGNSGNSEWKNLYKLTVNS